MKKRSTKKQWQAFEAQGDKDIDYAEIPELDDSFFTVPVKRKPAKVQVSMRLDEDIVAWLKGMGAGYQTRANMLLRKLMLAHRRTC